MTVTTTPSSASGHLAWRFDVVPVDAALEVSSIDAASGDYGFSGEAFRQVNPAGQSTVFTDFNSFFPPGEDETTDTQFTFARLGLAVVPTSEWEGATRLEAAFTGFPAIRVDSDVTTFAQVVTPLGSVGEFRGAFAVRPTGGGLAQLVEFGPIPFGRTPGDFDLDDDVDGSDFLTWQRGFGTTYDASDLANWESNLGTNTSLLPASTAVPEPPSIVLLGGLFAFIFIRPIGAR